MASVKFVAVSKKIAIVGGGISGMASMWKLKNTNWSVDLYEADGRLGGHANSTPFNKNGRSVDVDTGFIAMDESTYPQFSAFLKELDVKTIPTNMSFGVSVDQGIFEWGSRSFWSFTGDFSNLFDPWFWRLMFDLLRFFVFAPDIVQQKQTSVTQQTENQSTLNDYLLENKFESIGHYLKRMGYSRHFLSLVLIPMMAAPWCTDPEGFSQHFPARPLIHFMQQHGLLNVMSKTLRWRSFQNGSKTYVKAFESRLPSSCRVFLNSPVKMVYRAGDEAFVQLSDSTILSYDHVIIATHANQALRLLGDDVTGLEREILGCFKTTNNVCYLHSDMSLMPKRASAQMAWNCLLQRSKPISNPTLTTGEDSKNSHSRISLTFDMNKLQSIESFGKVLVTMNPLKPPSEFQSLHKYEHPLISSEAINASLHLHRINGVSKISFAGAWMGWGFHEDGFAAGTHVADMLINGSDRFQKLDLFGSFATEHQAKSFSLILMRWFITVVQFFISLTTQAE